MASKVNYNIYIYKVLKQVHPDAGISSGALSTMNEIVKSTIMDITKVANSLALLYNRKTVTSREIQAAVGIVLPGQLAKYGVSKGTYAVTKYNDSVCGYIRTNSPSRGNVPVPQTVTKTKSSQSSNARAEITFSPSRVRKLMTTQVSVGRIGVGAPIYLAAVIEYLMSDVIELSGNSSRDNKRVRIINRDIMLAVTNNEGLIQLYSPKKHILGGGVIRTI